MSHTTTTSTMEPETTYSVLRGTDASHASHPRHPPPGFQPFEDAPARGALVPGRAIGGGAGLGVAVVMPAPAVNGLVSTAGIAAPPVSPVVPALTRGAAAPPEEEAGLAIGGVEGLIAPDWAKSPG